MFQVSARQADDGPIKWRGYSAQTMSGPVDLFYRLIDHFLVFLWKSKK